MTHRLSDMSAENERCCSSRWPGSDKAQTVTTSSIRPILESLLLIQINTIIAPREFNPFGHDISPFQAPPSLRRAAAAMAEAQRPRGARPAPEAWEPGSSPPDSEHFRSAPRT